MLFNVLVEQFSISLAVTELYVRVFGCLHSLPTRLGCDQLFSNFSDCTIPTMRAMTSECTQSRTLARNICIWRIGCCHHSIHGLWSISAPKDIISRTIVSLPWLIVGRDYNQRHKMDGFDEAEQWTRGKIHTTGFVFCQWTHLRMMIPMDHSRVLISPDCRLMQGVDTIHWAPPVITHPPTLACHKLSGVIISGRDITDVRSSHSVPPKLLAFEIYFHFSIHLINNSSAVLPGRFDISYFKISEINAVHFVKTRRFTFSFN